MSHVLVIAAYVGLMSIGWCWWIERAARAGSKANRFDRYHWIYDRFMRLFNLYRVQEIRRMLMEECRTPGSLLDVGGGTGYLASQLTDLFSRVVVLDPSAGMLSVAKRRELRTCQASALELPFSPDEFDAILCTDALHHIKDANRAIAEMSRVLKPGGVLMILEFHIHGPAGWFLFWFERLCVDRSEFLLPAQLQACAALNGLEGTTHPISRLQYVYTGRKPIGRPVK